MARLTLIHRNIPCLVLRLKPRSLFLVFFVCRYINDVALTYGRYLVRTRDEEIGNVPSPASRFLRFSLVGSASFVLSFLEFLCLRGSMTSVDMAGKGTKRTPGDKILGGRNGSRSRGSDTIPQLCFSTPDMQVLSPLARTMTNDLDYFPKSKPSGMVASTSADIYVTTRRAWKEQQAAEFASTLTLSSFSDSAASTPSSSDFLIPIPKKRKHPDHNELPLPKAKKSRSPPAIYVTKPQPPPHPKAKKRATSSIPSSRQSSRPRTVASSPDPEYSASRSRSVSSFPSVETPILRPCWIDEDGTPGHGFISNEDVVRKLIENDRNYYKGCMCVFVGLR